jgi:transposase-like protein
MDMDHFSCPNKSCPDCDKVGAGNIALYTRYGRKQVRLLICNTCGKTFSELKGTPFWDSRLDWDTIEKIYRTLLEGQGIRATARLHKLSKNTVKRYLRLANKDFGTVEHFLEERGVIAGGNTAILRDLVDTHVRRSTAGNGAGHWEAS